ncbi:hypothetical protein GGX14DRAFT_394783 [Mycena pura]|uniref:Uncharacterized protein n=1 Tax=Mycena pura TaxID=153505 RepID=A0AAD6VDI8_9AGAR|nr:hypothetical protein GGX14DRAFT_394783 [Mycena pura]
MRLARGLQRRESLRVAVHGRAKRGVCERNLAGRTVRQLRTINCHGTFLLSDSYLSCKTRACTVIVQTPDISVDALHWEQPIMTPLLAMLLEKHQVAQDQNGFNSAEQSIHATFRGTKYPDFLMVAILIAHFDGVLDPPVMLFELKRSISRTALTQYAMSKEPGETMIADIRNEIAKRLRRNSHGDRAGGGSSCTKPSTS